jgi:1-acyl-sn-glycerol-3-phosphate acyltransferase
MVLLRSIAFNAVFYGLLVGMLIGGVPVLLTRPEGVKNYARLWARLSLRLFSIICGVAVDIRGVQNLPEGGVIVAAKHQSFLDILALITVLPDFTFVLKRELMMIPMFGQFLRRSGMIPIDRSKGRAVMSELNERVRSALESGHQLVIFPEGTRRPPGAEPQYKSGVSHLYAGADAPCVPVALNSGLFWPRRSFLRHPGRFELEFLPPIPAGRDRSDFLNDLQQRIEAASNRMLNEARTGRRGAARVAAALE